MIRLLLTMITMLATATTFAQTANTIDEMEAVNKECIRIKEDSVVCSRKFLAQMDSMVNIVFNEVKAKVAADEKAALVQDQMSWTKKKGEFFKKQDDTFVYNLQEGIWKKDMIRITYQQKADYLLKRIRLLLKKL
jgi:uncharacterized protein YecT (DUF1311 family)